MRSDTAGDKRHHALDGIRGAALLCIFVHHSVTHPISGDATRSTGEGAWGGLVTGLRLSLISFFVLSGFLLWAGFARAIRDKGDLRLGQYFKRRAARVLPAYYLAIAGSIALLWGAQMPNLNMPTAGELPLFAVLAQNYSSSTLQSLNGPTWTLSIEVAFYAVLPLMAYLLWRFRASPRAQLAVLGGFVALGMAWRAPGLGGDGPVWAKMLPAYLPYFAIGMALALWNQHRDRSRPPLSGRLTLGLVAIAAALVVADGLWHVLDPGPLSGLLGVVGDIPAAVGFAVLLGATLIGTGRSVSWLAWRPFVALGVISYGFYLWHLPLMLFWRRLGIEGGWVETAAITFPVTLAIAIASWKLVESPILKRAHRTDEPEQPARTEQPVRRREAEHDAAGRRAVRPRPVSISESR